MVAAAALIGAGVGRRAGGRHGAGPVALAASGVNEASIDTASTRQLTVGVAQSTLPTPDDLRRRVANLASGTYVNDILVEQDSSLYRWPERLSDAVRVFIEPTSNVMDWKAEYPEMARGVFTEWSEAGFPIRFAFVYDSVAPDISIHWIDRFPPVAGQRIGETERTQTRAYLIAHARVAVALHDSTGRTLSPAAVAGIVRHEVGHALGLNHARDPTSVMFHESATSTIAASDRATLRLLYLVPAGSLR